MSSSLFTNIPMEEIINIAVKVIFENDPNIKITQSELKHIFKIATSHTRFIFNGTYYDQIDGVAMGTPLAPVLANLFMGYHGKRWIDEYPGTPPLYYRRYVDYIFAIFNSKYDASTFFYYLNRHKNIKFTMELENQGKLSFLDVFIDNSLNSSSFITNAFHKTTYTGLLTNFQGFTAFSYKIGLIKCLIDRAYKINNTNFGFTNAVSEINATLDRNLFPSYLIDKVRSIYSEKVNKNDNQPLPQTEPNLRYFKLPYLGKYSETLRAVA